MHINPRGIWDCESGDSVHVYDPSVSNALVSMLLVEDIHSVVDFGCGTGQYARHMVHEGLQCEAYDGNPYTQQLTEGLGHVLDLSEPFDLQRSFDCVLSLEVAEHIPKTYESTFVQNIVRHAKRLLILSWAVEGQGGDGHVNCRNNDYVVEVFNQNGFAVDHAASRLLRDSATVAPWFRKTMLVFRKAAPKTDQDGGNTA